MKGFYLKAYDLLPFFLKRRINPLEFAIQEFVRSATSADSNSVILDAGAGEARFRDCFENHFYIALDSGVGDASWDYSRTAVLGDLQAIPLAGDSVDTVLNIQVLEHVRDPQRVLEEIHRVLKPGGHLHLTAPQGWSEHQQPFDFFRFTRFSLRTLLLSAGFQQILIEPMGGYFHYLGHRLTYIPKILFQERDGVMRLALFPLELVALVLFCFLGPLLCYYLDPMDRKKEFTLCYKCRAVKPRD